MKLSVLAGALAVAMLGMQAGRESVAQQTIPDAPKPQPSLPDLQGVTPGQGAPPATEITPAAPPAHPTPSPALPAAPSAAPPAQSIGGTQSGETAVYGNDQNKIATLLVHVDAVDVPFTVKDAKGHLVPGLTARDVQVYENNVRQHIDLFTNEALPLSVAVVIDQSMNKDEMQIVNDALGALPDAFSRYDEVAVYTYNHSVKEQTEFTAAQSPRLIQTIERAKSSGRDAIIAGDLEGPMTCTTCINGMNVDPNTSAQRGQSTIYTSVPREYHPLNDAILEAAVALSTKPLDRRRIIYVISDGKEYGSQAKEKDVIKYLQSHRIEVDGTLVGDSAVWGLGVLDRMHLPGEMRDNVLPSYANATGGNVDAVFRLQSIEKSFATIAEEARTRYTVGYTTQEPFVDGKYRKLEVVVVGHGNNLTVMAPPGYWPMAMEMRPETSAPAQ